MDVVASVVFLVTVSLAPDDVVVSLNASLSMTTIEPLMLACLRSVIGLAVTVVVVVVIVLAAAAGFLAAAGWLLLISVAASARISATRLFSASASFSAFERAFFLPSLAAALAAVPVVVGPLLLVDLTALTTTSGSGFDLTFLSFLALGFAGVQSSAS